MNTRVTMAALTTAALLSITACTDTTDPKPAVPESQASTSPPPASTPAAPKTPTAPKTPAPSPAEAETAQLPNMVGKVLQTAQDDAQAAGFYGLTSSDALGESRLQVLDRNWKVCSQTPGPGTHPTDTIVDFGAVKTEEACP